MKNDDAQPDGYYDEDTSSSKEDFDLSFLDEDESEE
jgi:hypothetical protein